MILIYVIYALIGIGLIIFIHEAGHFMAAKKVGVRVERFAIGFDPPFRGRNLRFFTFQRGETEYVVGMIPFGGYVKMAGETLMAGGSEGKPDELTSKSVGARALVFAAGAIMNILSAFVFFIIAFTLGVSFTDSEVGDTPPGSPAWEAGIRPGDQIFEIDGEEVIEQMEIRVSVALGDPSKALSIKVRRPLESATGEPSEHTFSVKPRWNAAQEFNWIGIIPAADDQLAAPDAGSAAAQAGIREGDRLVGLDVDGVVLPRLPVTHLFQIFDDLQRLYPETPFRVQVERDGTEQWFEFSPGREATGEVLPLIGVQSRERWGGGAVVRQLRPGSKAESAGIFNRGDTITHIDGSPVNTINWMQIARKQRQGTDLEIQILNLEGNTQKKRVETALFVEWILQDDIQWGRFDAAVPPINPDSSLASADLKPGDRIISLGGKLCFSPEELKKLAQQSSVENRAEVRVLRTGTILTKSLSRTDVEILARLTQAPFPPLTEVAQGGPAASVGIEQGAVIEQIGEESIGNWADLQEAVKKHQAGENVQIKWRTVEGESKEAEITIGTAAVAPLGLALHNYKQKLVKVGFVDAFKLGFRRTIIVSKWVFLTLRSLVRREVSPKHLSGPIGITQILTKVSEQKSIGTLLYFLALISVNLGLFNLLPFPVLDGGHLTFLLIEKIKGSPVDIRIQEWATNIAFVLILALAAFVTFHDFMRLM